MNRVVPQWYRSSWKPRIRTTRRERRRICYCCAARYSAIRVGLAKGAYLHHPWILTCDTKIVRFGRPHSRMVLGSLVEYKNDVERLTKAVRVGAREGMSIRRDVAVSSSLPIDRLRRVEDWQGAEAGVGGGVGCRFVFRTCGKAPCNQRKT